MCAAWVGGWLAGRRRSGAGYLLATDRLNNFRFWCCSTSECNDPSSDARGLRVPQGAEGFVFSQDPAWSGTRYSQWPLPPGT